MDSRNHSPLDHAAFLIDRAWKETSAKQGAALDVLEVLRILREEVEKLQMPPLMTIYNERCSRCGNIFAGRISGLCITCLRAQLIETNIRTMQSEPQSSQEKFIGSEEKS